MNVLFITKSKLTTAETQVFSVRPLSALVSLYKLYWYVPPQRVWFLSRFGLKTGIDFDHYGLKSGMVYKETTGAYKRICLFSAK